MSLTGYNGHHKSANFERLSVFHVKPDYNFSHIIFALLWCQEQCLFSPHRGVFLKPKDAVFRIYYHSALTKKCLLSGQSDLMPDNNLKAVGVAIYFAAASCLRFQP